MRTGLLIAMCPAQAQSIEPERGISEPKIYTVRTVMRKGHGFSSFSCSNRGTTSGIVLFRRAPTLSTATEPIARPVESTQSLEGLQKTDPLSTPLWRGSDLTEGDCRGIILQNNDMIKGKKMAKPLTSLSEHRIGKARIGRTRE